ncbi:MAG: tyrosine-type recombinase/integrase [Planctomycetota bacterium]
MNVRKRTFRCKATGEKRECTRWTVTVRDHLGRRMSVPGFTSRRASEELGRKLERLVAAKVAGEALSPDMAAWVDSLPMKLLGRLIKVGLIDAARMSRAKTLDAHIDDWGDSLKAKANTAKDTSLKTRRVRKLLVEAKIMVITDISVGTIVGVLAKLRDGGLARQTSNHYLQAIKQFTKWACREGRLSGNPLEHVAGLNVRVDQRRARRALTPAECRRLIDAAEREPERYGMAGPERSLLYRLALETGLRAAELRSLTRADFDLGPRQPSVTVRAGNAKNRREDILPLKAETASMLTKHLVSRLPTAPAFNMPDSTRTARMLRKDLSAAGIPYQDAAGRYADFHALRHTFVTALATSGVLPKVAQTLARHSDIHLTLDRYAHVLGEQQVDAINSLPDLSSPRSKGFGA